MNKHIAHMKEKMHEEEEKKVVVTAEPFNGSGASNLLQFNGYYQTGDGTFVNIENKRYYYDLTKKKKNEIFNDEFYVSYSLDAQTCIFVTQGDVTYNPNTNSATLIFGNSKLEFSRAGVGKLLKYNSLQCHQNKLNEDNEYVLTYVNGQINNTVITQGVNYLNYITLNTFVGTYNTAFQIPSGEPTLKYLPTMTITNNNEWILKQASDDPNTKPQVIQSFIYYSSMFTLSTNGTAIFLGSGTSGLVSYMIGSNGNFLLLDLYDKNANYQKVALSNKASHLLAPFTGYYYMAQDNCFFNIDTTMHYSWLTQIAPYASYNMTLTYSIDGKTIQNIKNIQMTMESSSEVRIDWNDDNDPKISNYVILTKIKQFDINNCLLTTVNGLINNTKINGGSTINLTPLKYFAANYQYQSPLPGTNKMINNAPTFEIKPDETVYLTVNGTTYKIMVYDYVGAMYLLKFSYNLGIEVSFTFMLGVGVSGICAYGIMTSSFGTEVYFLNAIKP